MRCGTFTVTRTDKSLVHVEITKSRVKIIHNQTHNQTNQCVDAIELTLEEIRQIIAYLAPESDVPELSGGCQFTVGDGYKTSDGSDARVYATDGWDDQIHGAIKSNNGWDAVTWTTNGHFVDGKNSGGDLMPKQRVVEGWVNLYENAFGLRVHPTFDEAEKERRSHLQPLFTFRRTVKLSETI